MYLDEAELHALEPRGDGLGAGAVDDDTLHLLVRGQGLVHLPCVAYVRVSVYACVTGQSDIDRRRRV